MTAEGWCALVATAARVRSPAPIAVASLLRADIGEGQRREVDELEVFEWAPASTKIQTIACRGRRITSCFKPAILLSKKLLSCRDDPSHSRTLQMTSWKKVLFNNSNVCLGIIVEMCVKALPRRAQGANTPASQCPVTSPRTPYSPDWTRQSHEKGGNKELQPSQKSLQ